MFNEELTTIKQEPGGSSRHLDMDAYSEDFENISDSAQFEDMDIDALDRSEHEGYDLENISVKEEEAYTYDDSNENYEENSHHLSESDVWEPSSSKKSKSRTSSKREDKVVEDDSNDEPLFPLMRAHQNPELHLEPTSQVDIVELEQKLAPDLWQDIQSGLRLLKNMPSKIYDEAGGQDWDLALMKTEFQRSSFAVPGERKCFRCNNCFAGIADKINHIVYTHDVKPYYCLICKSSFGKEINAFKHWTMKHKDLVDPPHKMKAPKNYKTCELCSLSCPSDLAYTHHKFQSHKKYKNANCPLCGKNCRTFIMVLRHILIEHGNFTYKCFLCDKFTLTIETFKYHLKQHEKVSDGALLEDSESRIKNDSVVMSEDVETVVVKVEGGCRDSISRTLSDTYPCDDQMNGKQEERIVEDDSNYDPLTPLLRAQANPEIHLEATSEESTQELEKQLSPDVWEDLCTGMSLMKSMPSKIDGEAVSLDWDISLMRVEFQRSSFGVPGERKCFKCNSCFVGISEKINHCVYSHDAKPFICLLCKTTFVKEKGFIKHNILKHSQNTTTMTRMKTPEHYKTCELCPLSCPTELSYWYHKFHSHKKYKNSKCPLCEKDCTTFVIFLRHVLIKHGNYTYKCFLCENLSNTMETFKYHLKQHERGQVNIKLEPALLAKGAARAEEFEIDGKTVVRKYIGDNVKKSAVTCDICGTVSRGAFNNARHLYTTHKIEREVECDKCSTLCKSVQALLDHKKSQHVAATCPQCGKVFVEKGHLENHLQGCCERQARGSDLADFNFMCAHCPKTFSRKCYLDIHMTKHSEKTLKCPICEKMYRWKSGLQCHLAASHGMGPKDAFTCEFCDKTFCDKSNYKQHRYTHTKEKPYNCDYCGRGFIRKEQMTLHKDRCNVTLSNPAGDESN